ncbi:MAG TPA: lysylphosphatidylglycerol synthase transmembrane domain-containing protein [Chloroflexota bacterium]|nr:lysylphosphatidylglycerol synthase transmembrane domain-containing protein [Chloroflexota bacterium]
MHSQAVALRRVRQHWRLVVGVLVSLFFLAWAARLVGSFGAMVESLGQANYLFLIPALVAYFAGVWLRAVRWHFLLRPIKPIASRRLFPVVVIGYMANDVLPARLGELVRAYVLAEQEDVPKTTTIGTIVVERLFDGIAMLIFVGIVGLAVPLDVQIAAIFRIAAVLFVGVLIALFVVGSSRTRAVGLIERLERLLPSSLEGKVAALTDRFLQGLDCLQSGRLSAVILLLSLGAWLCESTMYFVVALGFGLSLGFPAYMLTAAVANLGAMVPAAPGYVGTFDFGALASLRLFGAIPGQAAGYVLVLHATLLIPVTLLGFFYLWRANLSLRSLGQRVTVVK